MKVIKKYKILLLILLIPYSILIFISTYRTNSSVLLKGDITKVDSLIEIDSDNLSEGSFNTIYVINFQKSTILQNLILKNSEISEVGNASSNYQYMTNKEVSLMGKLQHESSIKAAILNAYIEASKLDDSIKLDYKLVGATISWYYECASNFKIGDEIIGVNNIYAKDNVDDFRNAFNNMKENDILNIIRDDKEIEVKLDLNHYRKFSIYANYDIDYDNATPKIKVNHSFESGPSGGLLQTLEVFNRLTKIDYTYGMTIAGTGTMNLDGSVGAIGGIKQKIHTAFSKKVDVFFCPGANYEEALTAYNTIKNKERMALVRVDTLEDAITYLKNVK